MALVISDSSPSFAISTSSAAAVVPPGEVTFCRKVAASSVERRSSSPEPATVARASVSASAVRQTGGRAGARHRLRQQKDVGGPRARQSRHRIHQRLVADPFDCAGRRQQRIDELRAAVLRPWRSPPRP